MKRKIIECDICGEEIEKNNRYIKCKKNKSYWIGDIGKYRSLQYGEVDAHICESCISKIRELRKNGEE